jgi:hypothetical protein
MDPEVRSAAAGLIEAFGRGAKEAEGQADRLERPQAARVSVEAVRRDAAAGSAAAARNLLASGHTVATASPGMLPAAVTLAGMDGLLSVTPRDEPRRSSWDVVLTLNAGRYVPDGIKGPAGCGGRSTTAKAGRPAGFDGAGLHDSIKMKNCRSDFNCFSERLLVRIIDFSGPARPHDTSGRGPGATLVRTEGRAAMQGWPEAREATATQRQSLPEFVATTMLSDKERPSLSHRANPGFRRRWPPCRT